MKRTRVWSEKNIDRYMYTKEYYTYYIIIKLLVHSKETGVNTYSLAATNTECLHPFFANTAHPPLASLVQKGYSAKRRVRAMRCCCVVTGIIGVAKVFL